MRKTATAVSDGDCMCSLLSNVHTSEAVHFLVSCCYHLSSGHSSPSMILHEIKMMVLLTEGGKNCRLLLVSILSERPGTIIFISPPSSVDEE